MNQKQNPQPPVLKADTFMMIYYFWVRQFYKLTGGKALALGDLVAFLLTLATMVAGVAVALVFTVAVVAAGVGLWAEFIIS